LLRDDCFAEEVFACFELFFDFFDVLFDFLALFFECLALFVFLAPFALFFECFAAAVFFVFEVALPVFTEVLAASMLGVVDLVTWLVDGFAAASAGIINAATPTPAHVISFENFIRFHSVEPRESSIN